MAIYKPPRNARRTSSAPLFLTQLFIHPHPLHLHPHTMQLSAFVSLVVSATAASAALIASAPLTECLHETVVSSGFIGKDHNVKFETSHCDDAPHFAADGELTGIDKRAVPSIVCDAPCASSFPRTSTVSMTS